MMRADLEAILREVSSASDLDEALESIVRRVRESLLVEACGIYLTETANDQLVRISSSGWDGSLPRPEPGALATLLDLVIARRELVLVRGTDRGVFALGMPLVHDHRVRGVLAAWKRADEFDRNEVTYFVTIAPLLARVIHESAAVREVVRLLDRDSREPAHLEGVPAAAGLAVGTGVSIHPATALESIPDRLVEDVRAEECAFLAAVAAARTELQAGSERLAANVPSDVREIFEFYVTLLGSGELIDETVGRIRAGSWARGAWRDTIAKHARMFDGMDDPYLRARGEDIREIGRRILLHLRLQDPLERSYPDRCILVGDTVSITDIAAVPVDQLAGIVCRHGSALSHTAVLARALGIPAVVGLSSLPVALLEGRTIVVDGEQGRIHVQPHGAELAAFERQIAEREAAVQRLAALRDLPAQTPDGVRLALLANIGLASDVQTALACGAEGVGLYRTEYRFLLSDAFPVENEQYEDYRRVLEAFAPRPVAMRTLDVGGDKVLPYFPVQESNPFLGTRGIRFSLEHPEIFMIQLRAMLRANAGLENLQVLFPMVARVEELDQALDLLARAHRELLEEGEQTAIPRTGAMIEVPSAVYLAGRLAKRVDFLSIGTNDLAQYVLAADRDNARVSTPLDSLHPAVLAAVRSVVEQTRALRKPVSVCGELASEPAGALALLGTGIDALSMSPASMPRVKLVIRSFPSDRARSLLERALEEEGAPGVSRLLRGALDDAGILETSPAAS